MAIIMVEHRSYMNSLTSQRCASVFFNSLAPGRPGCHFKTAIFSLVLLIGFFRFSNDSAPGWMQWDLKDDKSTLLQVMACCRQATSHYLKQWWPSSTPPCSVTRPQWIELILWIDIWYTSCEIGFWWVWQNHIDGKSTLLQVMAWCCQAASHYLSQCWPSSKSPYGVTRP